MSNVLHQTEEWLAARKSSKAAKQPVPKEHDEQAEFFAWWWQYADLHKLPRCLCFAIPNASALSASGRIYKWKEGLTAGVFDIFLSIPSKDFHGLYIEMKRNDRSQATDHQRAFGGAVTEQGYAATVCHSAQEAIERATTYLHMRK